MFGQPFMRALRGVPRPPFSQCPQAHAASHALSVSRTLRTAPPPRDVSRCASLKPSQSSSAWVPPRTSSGRCQPVPIFAQNFPGSRRPFFSGQRFQYQQHDQYNRFGGGGRQTVISQLLRRARPQHFVLIGVVVSGVYIYNTEEVEMTGRRRFNCVSRQQELKMGDQSYHEVLSSVRGRVLPENHPLTRSVNRVLQRLIPQAPIEGANWKVHVIKDDHNINAFVLPGGKVFVYTGILPVCGDDDGLAAVLGHEIAHVVAHHPAERMSNHVLTIGAVFVISFLFDVSGHLPSLLLNLVYGLPNSRTQEAEADNIGLMMMSKACFDPEAALRLWSRMQKLEKEAPPQFISTHPSSYNRMEAIRGWLAKAEHLYEDSGCSGLGRYMPGFRDAYASHQSDLW